MCSINLVKLTYCRAVWSSWSWQEYSHWSVGQIANISWT